MRERTRDEVDPCETGENTWFCLALFLLKAHVIQTRGGQFTANFLLVERDKTTSREGFVHSPVQVSLHLGTPLRYRRLLPHLRHRDLFLLQPMGFGAEGRWKPSGVNHCFRVSRYQPGEPCRERGIKDV